LSLHPIRPLMLNSWSRCLGPGRGAPLGLEAGRPGALLRHGARHERQNGDAAVPASRASTSSGTLPRGVAQRAGPRSGKITGVAPREGNVPQSVGARATGRRACDPRISRNHVPAAETRSASRPAGLVGGPNRLQTDVGVVGQGHVPHAGAYSIAGRRATRRSRGRPRRPAARHTAGGEDVPPRRPAVQREPERSCGNSDIRRARSTCSSTAATRPYPAARPARRRTRTALRHPGCRTRAWAGSCAGRRTARPCRKTTRSRSRRPAGPARAAPHGRSLCPSISGNRTSMSAP